MVTEYITFIQPHNYVRNCVVYIGTHDNDTLCGWLGDASEKTMTRLKKYLRAHEGESLSKKIISAAMASVADTVIITVQDLLGLGREARMNTPSTKQSNWTFRAEKDYLEKIDKDFLREITEIYFR